LWIQSTFRAHNFDELEEGLRGVDLSSYGGFEVHASCTYSALYHSEAVAERVRALFPKGSVGLHVRIHKDNVTVSIDTSGERLNRRGWRLENGPAPMRETVAQCLLRLAKWHPGEALCDPMCGSGTFLIEAATRGLGLAPGRLRTFSCDDWIGPGRQLDERADHGLYVGVDRDGQVLKGAVRNAGRAGVNIDLLSEDARATKAPAESGLLMTNPPYGLRLKQGNAYAALGALLAGEFRQWRAAIVCPDERAIKALGRKPVERIRFSQGGVGLILAMFEPTC
ncbi:MAG: THUMP domain-containing class I SAM-dependent RNA methyltransferase, partial [Bradymonadia bacterium]